MMLDHVEVNQRFMQLDSDSVLLAETFDGWLAWPIVKERLWLACFESATGTESRLLGPIARLASGLLQLRHILWLKSPRTLALFYEPREVRAPDGRILHPHLGALPGGRHRAQVLHYQYDWNVHSPRLSGPGFVQHHGIGALVAAGSLIMQRRRQLMACAQRLSAAVREVLPELADDVAVKIIANQLARFRLQFALTRRLLMRAGVRSVVVLDAFAKTAEIAAAKSLGLSVLEVQHGMFSSSDPAYAWRTYHRECEGQWPLPDRVAVFGPLWSGQLRSAGFWRADEVIEVPNPLLAAYRSFLCSRKTSANPGPFKVLFSAQGYVKEAALGILESFLALENAQGTAQTHLRIKMHPLERNGGSEYHELARRYPRLCSVADPDRDSFQEMAEADCVIGFTSLMLLEALALGIPAIGLRGGAASAGFCATFSVPQLTAAIPEAFSGEDLHARVETWRQPQNLARQREIIAQHIATIYSFDGACIEAVIKHV